MLKHKRHKLLNITSLSLASANLYAKQRSSDQRLIIEVMLLDFASDVITHHHAFHYSLCRYGAAMTDPVTRLAAREIEN